MDKCQNFFNSFNTQPPKGGWSVLTKTAKTGICFNTQPPKGGWPPEFGLTTMRAVSTHSRLKAAGRLSIKRRPIK